VVLFGDRFPHGSRNLASSSGERGEEESGTPNHGSLIPTTEEVMNLRAPNTLT
jgi:hypothetical protein